MKDREHHDSIGFNAIEDGIREAAGLHATNVVAFDGKAFRICRGENDGAIDLDCESQPKTNLPFLVPQRRAVEFGARGAPKDDL